MTTDTGALGADVFDLAAALSDISYGSEEVTIFLNEGEGRAIAEGQRLADEALLAGDREGSQAIEEKWRERAVAFAKTAIVVDIHGISPQEGRQIAQDALEKYPTKRTALGIKEDNLAQDAYFTEQKWLAHIKSLSSNGKVDRDITIDKVKLLLAKAPQRAQATIAEAIDRRTDNTNWFVEAASDVDF